MRGLANEDAQKNVPLGKTDYQAGDFSGDTKTTLDLEDDAAFCNWGGAWRMPTIGDFTTFLNGASSYTVGEGGSFTHQDVTFPAAGNGNGTDLNYAGANGSYWSSSLSTDYPLNAFFLSFDVGAILADSYNDRFRGGSVRPLSE